jgi:hypothetical protein
MSKVVIDQPSAAHAIIGDRLDKSMDKIAHALHWVSNNSDIIVGYALNIVSAIIIIIVGMMLARFISSL